MKATFVLGLPQTQEQKNQARAAIQGNSSLIRWRKSGAATQAQPTRVRKRRKTDDQQSALTSTELVSSENKTSSTYSVLDIRYVDTPDFWNQLSRVGFDKTLDTPLLPPFLPLGYPDFHTKDDVWVKLQKIHGGVSQLYPNQANGSPIASGIMKRVVSSSTVFLAFIFGQAVHNAHEQPSAQTSRLVMEYYARAVEAVNQSMQTAETACTDDNILAVASLSHHDLANGEDTVSNNEEELRPSQGPLNALRLLNVFGGHIKPATTHTLGLLRMVELRGGINEIIYPGVAHQLCYSEVIQASRTLQAPRLDFAPCMHMDLESSLAGNRRTDHPLRQMGSGFDVLPGLDNFSNSAKILQNDLRQLAQYSLGVDDYIAGRAARKSPHLLAEERLYAQHMFLSLLSSQSDKTESSLAPVLALCRLAGIVYSYLCVFPLPAAPFELAVDQLAAQLEANDFRDEWALAPHLMIWIVFMFGIAAMGMPEQARAVAILDRCVRRLHIASWEELKGLLLTFLWLPITNDADGIDLWDKIEESNPLS